MSSSTVILMLSALLPLHALAASQYRGPVHDGPPPRFAADRLLVTFQPGTAASEVVAAHRLAGGHTLKVIPGIGVHVVQVRTGTVLDNISLYQASPNVKFAEPDFSRALRLPDESSDNTASNDYGLDYFLEQWGLNDPSQFLNDPSRGKQSLYEAADADIDAPEKWNFSTGDPRVIIARLDSGVDFVSNLEFLDKCVDKQDFVSSHGDTTADIVAHGAHTAGIAAARIDNQFGVVGVG